MFDLSEVLKIENLAKSFPKFTLNHVSFSVQEGQICGFIGRNGAGKTTTLKSLVNMVHPDSGKIEIAGYDFSENELKCKENVGLVFDNFAFYKNKTLDLITLIYKKFYKNWDDALYLKWMKLFKLDGDKLVSQLSTGMRLKYALAVALSHNAKLLIDTLVSFQTCNGFIHLRLAVFGHVKHLQTEIFGVLPSIL